MQGGSEGNRELRSGLIGILGVAAIIWFLGCSGSTPERAPSDAAMARHDTLSATAVVRNDLFGTLSRVVVVGSQIWVLDRKGEPFLHEIDLESGQLIRSRGRRGGGPGEFRRIATVGAIGQDSIGVFDESLGRLTRIGVHSGSWEGSPSIPLGELGGMLVLSLLPLPGGQWLGKTYADSGSFVVLHADGTLSRTVAVPMLGGRDTPLQARKAASVQGGYCASPDGRFMAVAYAYAPRVTIVELGTGRSHNAETPATAEPRWMERDGGVTINDSTVFYRDCVITERSVFALFLGKNIRLDGAATGLDAATVHVFDLEGQLTAVWSLEKGISTLAYDPLNGRLIGAAVGEGEVVGLTLPPDRDW